MTNQTTLEHHGIRGMKWGIRRYQNKDGSLTPEGKARYKTDSDGSSDTYYSSRKRTSNNQIKKMSTEELQKRIARLQVEKNYKDLERSVNMSKGQTAVEDALLNVGKQTIQNIGTQVATRAAGDLINKVVKKAFKNIPDDYINPKKGQTDKK